MLARPHRMTDPAEFSRTIRRGSKSRSGGIVTYLLLPQAEASASKDEHSASSCKSSLGDGPVDSLPETQVGFVVNRRVANAVGRHRVTRVLRGEVRHWLHLFPSGSHLVVRALPGSARQSNRKISADLAHCLRRLQTDRDAVLDEMKRDLAGCRP
jgi:ribonuclease P protein component